MPDIPGSEVYVNGRWLARPDASVSVFDRGFLFGDGIYEVVTAYARQPFLIDAHLSRLEYSLDQIKLANPFSRRQWRELIEEAAARQDFADQKIYLQISRGSALRAHRFPDRADPSVVLFVDPFIVPDAAQLAAGMKTITLDDFRWQRGDIKATSLLAAVLASQLAAEAAADEAIWIRNGEVCEGASSNLLAVIDGRLCSPAPSSNLLRGVTLDYMIEIAEADGLQVDRRVIKAAELQTAQEVMLTSAAREIAAVTSIDGRQVGEGRPGAMHGRLHRLYRGKTDELTAAVS